MTRRQKETGALVGNTVRGWRWRAQAFGAALAGAMMLIASTAAAYPVCTSSITACCRITKPGYYVFTAPVTVPSTSTGGACIQIVTSGVALNGQGGGLYGNKGTGTGVHLLPAAAGDVVYSIYPITDFKTGIVDDAPRSVLSGFESAPGSDGVSVNKGNGIVIRANRVALLGSSADSNDSNGVVVKPRAPATVVSSVYLGNVEAGGNTKAGFLLKSLSTFTATASHTGANGTDGADLINSVDATIINGEANGNTGDGVKVVGGHDDVVSGELLGNSSLPNEIGLEVRNSAFDTIAGDAIFHNTEDGMLVVNGNRENIVDDASNSNGGSGIHLKRTTTSRLNQVYTDYNTDAGIWLDGSSGISVEGSGGISNHTSDVYIGCSSAQEPDGTTCASRGLPASNGNRVVQGTFNYSSGTKPDVGIGIDLGNHQNHVLDNHATGNATDLMDKNTNCDSNLWMFNAFIIASPPTCIPTF